MQGGSLLNCRGAFLMRGTVLKRGHFWGIIGNGGPFLAKRMKDLSNRSNKIEVLGSTGKK